ncbi:MAG: hypothetical protein U9N49_00850 [Campylobacterota bacterium]|nr:hypothetical protein [Campylobacterota bacterium]
MSFLSNTTVPSTSDRSSDVMLYKNKSNLFNLANQVLYRQSGIYSMNALQIRAISQSREEMNSKGVLALHENIDSLDQLNPTQTKIYNYLRSHMPLSLNDGNAYSAGYDANTLQSLYLKQSLNDTFNTLWLPYNLLGQYRQRHESDSALAIFKILNIQTTTESITSLYRYYKMGDTPLEPHITESLTHYLATKDIAEIEKLHMDQTISLKVTIDQKNRQPYLIVLNAKRDKFIAIMKLNAQPPYNFEKGQGSKTLQEQLESFYLGSSTFLEVSAK